MDLENLKNNPEQIKQLIGLLSSLLPTQENTEHDIESSNTIKTHKSKAKASNVNLFDKMMEKNHHKDDTLIDKKLCKLPPTQRARSFEYVDIKCRCCGKTEKCNPSLVMDRTRYKCNKCSTTAG